MKGRVQTVLGPIAPEEIGVTITHEHILSRMPHLTDTPLEDPGRGAFFDEPVTMENMPTDAQRADWIAWLFERGCGDRVVISHDVIFKNKLARYGGHGYAHIIENVVPLMRRKGFQESEIDAMLVRTPQRLFTFA